MFKAAGVLECRAKQGGGEVSFEALKMRQKWVNFASLQDKLHIYWHFFHIRIDVDKITESLSLFQQKSNFLEAFFKVFEWGQKGQIWIASFTFHYRRFLFECSISTYPQFSEKRQKNVSGYKIGEFSVASWKTENK